MVGGGRVTAAQIVGTVVCVWLALVIGVLIGRGW